MYFVLFPGSWGKLLFLFHFAFMISRGGALAENRLAPAEISSFYLGCIQTDRQTYIHTQTIFQMIDILILYIIQYVAYIYLSI